MSPIDAADRTHGTLVLLRHGQSVWNGESRFTGWIDVGLTEVGCEEAVRCGRQLDGAGLRISSAHTSYLRRSITTAALLLDAANRHWVPVSRSWRLNERHYGALQGQSKRAVRERVGDEQFLRWRRAYGARPPALGEVDRLRQREDVRYADLGDAAPVGESLDDVSRRLLPYWRSRIVPELRSGTTVLVVGHSNSLRAMIKHLDQLSDEDIVEVNVPTGMPLIYEFDSDLNRCGRGYFLDAEAAGVAARAVANEGRRSVGMRGTDL